MLLIRLRISLKFHRIRSIWSKMPVHRKLKSHRRKLKSWNCETNHNWRGSPSLRAMFLMNDIINQIFSNDIMLWKELVIRMEWRVMEVAFRGNLSALKDINCLSTTTTLSFRISQCTVTPNLSSIYSTKRSLPSKAATAITQPVWSSKSQATNNLSIIRIYVRLGVTL